MRFKAGIQNVTTFSKFIGSLASLGRVAWVRLSEDDVRFTIIPEQGTQVWATLSIDTVFEPYTIQSATENNAINMEVPMEPLLRALRSATNADSASIRLTKKDGLPWLVLTIVTTSITTSTHPTGNGFNGPQPAHNTAFNDDPFGDFTDSLPDSVTMNNPHANALPERKERETLITLDIPIRVLGANNVAGLHEPHSREPDVHIVLPPLLQLKTISDRFIRLAAASSASATGDMGGISRAKASTKGPRIDLAATMHGTLRLTYGSDALKISTTWRGLDNPELDPQQVAGGEEGLRAHPSTRMRAIVPDDEDDESEGWAKIRIDAKDWSKVLSVGRVGGRVIACLSHGHALILYVYLPSMEDPVNGGGEESVLTYYTTSYSI